MLARILHSDASDSWVPMAAIIGSNEYVDEKVERPN